MNAVSPAGMSLEPLILTGQAWRGGDDGGSDGGDEWRR